jgi:hypothetical protein
MRKVFLSAAALTVGGLMFHGAYACELNREASQPASAIVLPSACSGSNCLVNPPQDPLDCGAAYFGSDSLLVQLLTPRR